jgi:dTDP-4-dehydrorhamnose reductase
VQLTKVLITGAGGQLAGAIAEACGETAQVFAYSHAQLDIANAPAVRSRVGADRPDLIVNCAAFNDVDRAEDEAEQALTANAFGVRVLARAAADVGAVLVHYSSDFVFDGRASRPYTEQDAPNPQSVYAASKLLGEWFAREAPRAYVLRVESLFGGRAAKGSIDRIVSAIAEGRDTKVFVDRTVSPSYVVDVAAATRALIERGEPGLYHCVNSGCCTWHELAQEIARVMGKAKAHLVPVAVSDVQLRASRPQFAALANQKLCGVFPMPAWQDALRRYLKFRAPAAG